MRLDAISIGENPPHEVNAIIEVPIGGVDVPDQVVRIGRIAVELEGLLRRRHRAIQVSLRDQLPAAV